LERQRQPLDQKRNKKIPYASNRQPAEGGLKERSRGCSKREGSGKKREERKERGKVVGWGGEENIDGVDGGVG